MIAIANALTATKGEGDTYGVVENTPTYTPDTSDTVTIEVTNGTGSNTYWIGDVVTIRPDGAATGYRFSHWEVNGVAVSYYSTYNFYASVDATYTAVYVADDAEVEVKALASMSYFKEINGTWYAVAEFSVPEGYTIIEAGIDLYENGNIKKSYMGTTDAVSYRFTLEFGGEVTGYTVCAVLRYKDANGNVVEITSGTPIEPETST